VAQLVGLGPICGLSARQLNSCLPRREEKRRKEKKREREKRLTFHSTHYIHNFENFYNNAINSAIALKDSG